MTAAPPGPSDPDLVELSRRLDESMATVLEEAERSRTSAAQEPARVWAALAPGWTIRLAEACGFPTAPDESVADALARLRAAGVVDVYPVDAGPDAGPDADYYVMTAVARAETMRAYLAVERNDGAGDPPAGGQRRAAESPLLRARQTATARGRPEVIRGAGSLLATTAQIGAQVHAVRPVAAVPEPMLDWSELAIHAEDAKAAAKAFEQKLAIAFEVLDVATIRDWIDVARPLAVLFEYAAARDLSLAIAGAGRTIELSKRRELDFRHLMAFHRREEQIEAIRTLVDGPDDRWALHLIGPGGVGKTMVVRYATCLMTQAPGSPCSGDPRPFDREAAVARVDFDYLNLDYPRLNPGLLLVDLAAELRPAGNVTTNNLFDRAEEQFTLLHETQKADGLRRERATLDPRMAAGIRAYIEAIQSIGKRVVIVLDTCEELAKVEPEAGTDSTLEETFRILRALHDGPDALVDDQAPPNGGVPGLRVIFSGRRALAAGGAGWNVPSSTLPDRPYLRIHEIRGFSHDETRLYLKHEKVPELLVEPVIRASSPDLRTSIEVDYDDPDDGPRDVPRCNPYLVRMYLDWARSTPPPTPEMVETAGSGRYVELRLIQRLRDAGLEEVLPRVATLGHFDLTTFRAAANLGEEEGERQFRALADQEWVGMHRSGGEPEREILDLAPDVRDMLVRYFAGHGRPQASELEPSARAIEQLTIEGDLGALDWADFDSGLRVLAHDPARGATWWTMVQHRLFAERPAWMREVLDRVLSSDGAARPVEPDDPIGVSENPLRPFVLATRVRLLQQAGDAVALGSAWLEVAEAARAHAKTPLLERLYRRALAGQVAAARHAGAPPSADLVHELWVAWQAADLPFANAQEAASALAAIETLVDFVELDPAANRKLLELPRPGPGFAPTASRAADELDTGFRPSRNAWRFVNSFPPGPIAKVSGLSIGDAADGLDGGMAVAAVDLWMRGIAPPDDTSPPPNGSPEFAYLARRQTLLVRRGSTHSFAETWPSIRADIAAGRPVPLRLSFRTPARQGDAARDGRHHVVGFAAAEAADHIEIRIYDPNHPGDDSLAIVATLATGGGWTIDHPDFGPLTSVDRVAYEIEVPTPWVDLHNTRSAREGIGLTTSGPQWVAAEVERTHSSWLADTEGGPAAIDALRAMLHLQAGRAAVLAPDPDWAGHLLARALELVPAQRPEVPWVDWQAPPDVATRVRLEVARTAYPAVRSPAETIAMLGVVDADVSTADGDRLVSTILAMRLAERLTETPEGMVAGWKDVAKWLLVPNVVTMGLEPINAHRLVPPLFVRVAELQSAFGLYAQARRHLQAAAATASAAQNMELQRSADRAMAWLSRRLRSTDEGETVAGSLASSPRLADRALFRSLQGLAGPAQPLDRGQVPPEEIHLTWQASYAIDRGSARDLVTWGLATVEPAATAVPSVGVADSDMLFRDLRELVLVAAAYGVHLPGRSFTVSIERSGPAWSARYPGRPEGTLRVVLRDAVLGEGMPSIEAMVPASLLERIGPRRCAEIAFEEAELLALRLPEAAVPILAWANARYATCRDAFGAFSTAALAALLGTHPQATEEGPGGTSDDAAPFAAAALAAYLAMAIDLGRRGVSTLATTEELEAIAAAPTDAAFDQLEPPELRPWFARLIASLAVRSTANGPSGVAAADAFATWLEQRYGVSSATGVALPTEWARYRSRRGSGPVDLELPAAPSAGRDIATLVGTAIGLVVGLFIGWHYLVALLWSGVDSLGFWQQFALYGLTLAAFGLLIWIGRRFGDSMKTLTLLWTRLDVDIQLSDAPGGTSPGDSPSLTNASSSGSGRVAVKLTPTMWILRPVRGLPPLQLRPYRAHPSEVAVVSDLDAYVALARSVPDGLKGLVAAQVPLMRPPWQVRLSPRGDLHRFNWEAMLALAMTGPEAAPTDLPVRVTRLADASRPDVRRAHAGRLIGETIAGDDVAAGIVRRALEKRTGGKIAWSLVRAARSPDTGEPAASDVVHVIGITVEDHGGRALRLAPARAYGSQVAPSSSSAVADTASDQVLRPEDLRRAYPQAGLFIVQGYPPEEATGRVGSDREAANLTRLFATELARLGSRVVVIPPLEPSLATTAWDAVNRAAAGFATGGPAGILSAVTKVQAAVLTSGQRPDAWERALDVCVFDMPTRRQG